MSKQQGHVDLAGKDLEFERMQADLRRTQALLEDEIKWRRLLVNESRDGIVVLDLGGNVVEANKRFAEMLGYTLDEVSRLHVWDWDAQHTKEQILAMTHEVGPSGHFFETRHRRKDGGIIDVELSNNGANYRGAKLIFCICRDITSRKKAEKEREDLIKRLQESLAEIRTLRKILPLCSFCKKVRDDKGYWEQVDVYLHKHSSVDVSHGICPECMKKHYPDEYRAMYPDE